MKYYKRRQHFYRVGGHIILHVGEGCINSLSMEHYLGNPETKNNVEIGVEEFKKATEQAIRASGLGEFLSNIVEGCE